MLTEQEENYFTEPLELEDAIERLKALGFETQIDKPGLWSDDNPALHARANKAEPFTKIDEIVENEIHLFELDNFLRNQRRKPIQPAPTAKLSTGLVVANFSSPHTFTFTDGTMLDACPDERVKAGACNPRETVTLTGGYASGIAYSAVKLEPVLSDQCIELLDAFNDSDVDIVIVPLMLLEAIKDYREKTGKNHWERCHAIRRPHRGSNEVCHDRFCI